MQKIDKDWKKSELFENKKTKKYTWNERICGLQWFQVVESGEKWNKVVPKWYITSKEGEFLWNWLENLIIVLIQKAG